MDEARFPAPAPLGNAINNGVSARVIVREAATPTGLMRAICQPAAAPAFLTVNSTITKYLCHLARDYFLSGVYFLVWLTIFLLMVLLK